MPDLIIRNVRIVEPGRRITAGDVLIQNGLIASFGTISTPPESMIIEGAGRVLTPGLVDIHTHGIGHYHYHQGAAALCGAASNLGRFGVTTVLPTVIPQANEGTFRLLSDLAQAIPGISDVDIPGLHLEGPFMALGGASCPTLPGDLSYLERLLDAANGRVVAMSVSPDAPNILPVIRHLRAAGIRVFITHTRANVEQTEAALEAGATHATHFYNVFYAPEEIDPGVRPVGAVEAILAEPKATVDFIADGVHVHPAAIRAAVAAKSWRGIILITDSNIGAGLAPGIYETPWGYPIRVAPGAAARHATKNHLAGSALTMNRGLANLLGWLPLPAEQVWAMATLNPATLLGLERKGRIEVGADADLVLWAEDMTPVLTWKGGRIVHEK